MKKIITTAATMLILATSAMAQTAEPQKVYTTTITAEQANTMAEQNRFAVYAQANAHLASLSKATKEQAEEMSRRQLRYIASRMKVVVLENTEE